MSPGPAVATATAFVWLGIVLAISFLEAPLKFHAPGVTLPLGLGIGRLVFGALNRTEAALVVVLLAGVAGAAPTQAVIVAAVPVVVLIAQLAAVRPRLTQRSDRILTGEKAPRSRAHLAYLVLETAKVLALLAAGVLLLAT